jgi:type IV pilus assembly protein PilA
MKSPSNKPSPRRSKRLVSGFSMIELLVAVTIILIVAAMAIPNLLRSRISANQAAVVSNIRTITNAAVSYFITYGNGYPPTLGALGGVNGAAATCTASLLIDSVLATTAQRSGYQITYAGQQGNVGGAACATPGFNGFLITAVPIAAGLSGHLSYCSSEPGVIHYDPSGVAAPDEIACAALPVL